MRASLRQHNSPPIYLPSPPACPVVSLIHSDNATIHKTKNYGYCSPPSPPPTPPSSSCYKVWYPILYNNAPLSSCDLSRGNSKVGIISEQSKALYQNKKLQRRLPLPRIWKSSFRETSSAPLVPGRSGRIWQECNIAKCFRGKMHFSVSSSCKASLKHSLSVILSEVIKFPKEAFGV